MRAFIQSVFFVTLPLVASAQQILDRIAVVVNDHVITQSDWDHQAAFEALAEGRPPEAIQRTAAVLERLVYRELLLQQMAQLNFRQPVPEEDQRQVEAIRKQLPPEETSSKEAWRDTLMRYGITEEDFNQIVAQQADVARFIDVRFRSNTRINNFEIENYYRQTFVPQFQQSAGDKTPPPLKDVQDRIQTILLEQQVNEGVDSLVQGLRAQAVIRYLPGSAVTPQPMTEGRTNSQPK